MSFVDRGSFGGGIFINESKSVLVETSDQLILLVSDSLLVGLEVSIRVVLISGGVVKISCLSGGDHGHCIQMVGSLQLGIEGSLLVLDGGGVDTLSGAEAGSVLVGGGSEVSGSGGLGSGGIGISRNLSIVVSLGGSLVGLSDGVSSGGLLEDGGLVGVVGLGSSEGSLIQVVWETLVAPVTI